MRKQLFAFKQILSYVSVLTEKTISGDIYPVIADRLDMKPKTIETIGKTRVFTRQEIPSVLDALINFIEDVRKIRNEEKKIFPLNTRILYELSWDFLETSIDEKAFIGMILSTFQIFHNSFEEKRNNYIDKIYSNRFIDFNNVYVKKQSVYTSLCDKIDDNKVTFLVGPPKSGKTQLVQYYVKKDRQSEHKFNSYFFFKGKNLNMNFVLSQIITSFTGHDLVNYTLKVKKDKVKKYLTAQKSLIVIEHFGNAQIEVIKEFLEFFVKDNDDKDFLNTDKTKIILLGKKKERRITVMLNDMDIGNETVNATPELNLEDWQHYTAQMAENSDKIKKAIEKDPTLVEWCYNLNKENIHLLGDIIARVSREAYSSNYENIEIEKEKILNSVYNAAESDEKLEEIYNSFTGSKAEHEKNLVTIISMFDEPVGYAELKKMWSCYIEFVNDDKMKRQEAMGEVIDFCCDKFYLERYIDKQTSEYWYKVPYDFKRFIRKKLSEDDETCLLAADVCIRYYINETTCKDRLQSKVLGRRIDDNKVYGNMRLSNILNVLEYCEKRQRWSEYYSLCWNMRYYFFSSGLNGKGSDSFLYKCAVAARNLGNYNEEYEALLYFCNLSFRIREVEGTYEAMRRIMEINTSVPQLDERLKCKFHYVKGLEYMSISNFYAAKDAFDLALGKFKILLKESKRKKSHDGIADEKRKDIVSLEHDITSSEKWMCDCLCYLVKENSLNAIDYCNEANSLLDETQKKLVENGSERRAANCIFSRAWINFYTFGLTDKVEEYLKNLDEKKSILIEDAYYTGKYNDLMKDVATARKKKNTGKEK